MRSRWFSRGVVASPHHLASAAGHAVLADGGNAVDAAVAANLVLAVVTPYHCGLGGDLLAIVWDGAATGVVSVGAAPAGATPDAIRSAIDAGHGDPATALPGTDGMPSRGALPVTVPGALAGWARLLERWGTRSLGSLIQPALRLAADGFVLSPHGAQHVERARPSLIDQPGWAVTYGPMRAGRRFVQPDLAATLRTVAADGPDAMYRGPIGAAVVDTLQAGGSTMTAMDLAAHEVDEVVPIRGRYRELDVLELPPPTQGVTALTALGILEAAGAQPPDDPAAATHLRVEAVRAAMADRQEHLADPTAMRTSVEALRDPDRLAAIAAAIDPGQAGTWPVGRPAPGGTAYLCAADADGLLISLIQSNFVGFGSGVVARGTGIGLHDRGAHFALDPAAVNVIGPRRRPPHTLIPALALHDGRPSLVFGAMGGDGQPQTHVQLLGHLVDGAGASEHARATAAAGGAPAGDGGVARGLRHLDVQTAIDAPRFVVDVADGSVVVEADLDAAIVEGLERRGHRVTTVPAHDHLAGHAHAIAITDDGYVAGSDPRCEGGAVGW